MIPDLNLKLAIIQELRDLKKIPKFSKKDFWKKTFGIKYDMDEEYNYRLVPEVVMYYQNLEIPADLLFELKSIFWMPSYKIKSDKIHNDIFDQWGGEDNEFQIISLEGIEHCQNLKEIYFDALGIYSQGKWDKPTTYASLLPLQKLLQLDNLALHDSLVSNLDVILEIKSLQKVKLVNVATLENTDLQKLKADLESKHVVCEIKG